MAKRLSTVARRTAPLPGQSVLNDVSAAWVSGLVSSGEAREAGVKALHAVLLTVARHEVARRAGSLQLHGGMTCNHCAHAVRTEVSAIEGVTDVYVDPTCGILRVTAEQPVPPAAIRDAVKEAGYTLA